MFSVTKFAERAKFLRYTVKYPQLKRLLYTILKEEYTVPQYCNLNVTCPYKVNVKPLDALDYLDNECLKLSVLSQNKTKTNLKCKIDYNNIYIEDNVTTEDCTCEIEVPYKTNLKISSNSSITVLGMQCEVITLDSQQDINLDNCQADKINAVSAKGNINSKNALQATDICLKAGKNGSVSTGKLQGINLKIETENGEIKVMSSYCDSSFFQTSKGKINLQNTHKNNKIVIQNEGSLTLAGLDGSIDAVVKKGNIDIQISRILENSKITLVDQGKVALKLSESVQDDNIIEILAKYFVIDKNVIYNLERCEEKYILTPPTLVKNKCYQQLILDCKSSNVILETASWSDMIKLQL